MLKININIENSSKFCIKENWAQTYLTGLQTDAPGRNAARTKEPNM
jgi:hypothetical protein